MTRRTVRKQYNRIAALLFGLGITAFGCVTAPTKQKPASRPTSRPASRPVTKAKTWKTIAVGKGPDALFLTPNGKYIYVANVEDKTVTVIDNQTEKAIKQIKVIGQPWGFHRIGDTNLVAVSNYNKGLDLIDFTKHEVTRSQTYPFKLGGITGTSDGKTLYVVNTEGNEAVQIDVKTLKITERYKTEEGPDGIGISKDQKKIYVTNTKSGSISIIQTKDKKTTTIKTGGKPELIHYNKDHSRLFISNHFKNKVHVLDTQTDKIIHEITELSGPEEAVLSHSEAFLFVVNLKSSKIFVYNTKSFKKLSTEFLVGKSPIGILPTKDDQKFYVTNYGDNTVSVIKHSF